MTDDALSPTCCPDSPVCDPGPPARLSLWPGRAVYSGPSLELDLHSGSVAVLAVGNDKEFTLETADGARRRARSALIRARVPHRIEAHGGWMTFCYFEPGSAAERACGQALGAGEEPVTISAAEEKDLVRLCTAPERAEGPDLDPRIRAAVRKLLREPQLPYGAAEFAAVAGLSRSRFLHLFREQTGTSFRRFRMWARMLRAGRAFLDYGTLTDAAAAAGFSSPSHLSSAFHATFGLRPSRVLAAGCVIVDETPAGTPGA
ncbi:helix-turn-helix transcriptional regulator [Streptomyces piniterrae]|uniref:Helix-turn-helix transcriptional regulator n=1 Tax=Streptomyces piniterrae TaxID=2571125 RepID=A0A4U0NDM5_9ACTN|nr:AraC family transcriptional regulator [Streptomyces piniterrae]TJZ52096.1 helix-turn-helix transcriptional regulator [Streptomyces piniterrae]